MAGGARSGKWVVSRKFYWTVLLWPTNQRELEAVSVAGGPRPLLQPFPLLLGMWGPGWMWGRQSWAVLGLSPASVLRRCAGGPATKTEKDALEVGTPRAFAPTWGGAVSSVVTLEQEAQRALGLGRQEGQPRWPRASWDRPSSGSAGAVARALRPLLEG